MLSASRVAWLPGALVVTALGLPREARAADVTRVATAFDEGDAFDLFLSAGWRFETQRAHIKREFEQPGRTLDQIEIVRDLKYQHDRHILDLRADFGVFWDLSFYIEAPIVFGDTRTLSFDQDADSCVFTGPRPSCVDASNSTTLNDQAPMPGNPNAPTILPGPATPGTNGGFGLDATGAAPRLFQGGTRVFAGPQRGGLESLNLGLNWAILNQRKDDTKPTWTVGFEARIQVDDTQRFERARPTANTSVGLGYHVLRLQTFVSKQFRYVDPYLGFWYERPIVRSEEAFPDFTKPGSLGAVSGTGQKKVDPMQSAGIDFGFEAIAYQDQRAGHRVAFDFHGRIKAHFEGRGWSELWEILACSNGDAARNLVADPPGFESPLCAAATDPFGLSYLPGTTDIENYASVGGDFGVTVQIGHHLHLRAAFGADHDQSHTITATDAGRDRDGNGMVDPTDKNEANPLHRPQVDLVGRRYRVDDSTLWNVNVTALTTF
jgi:hypothetical protein